MVLLLAAIGVAVVAVALRNLLSAPGLELPVVLVTVLVVVLSLGFWTSLWPQLTGLVTAHQADDKLSLGANNTEPGSLFGTYQPFLDFVADTVPAHARVFIECGQHEASCGSQEDWFGYDLLPRVFVAKPAQAQWAIFYNANGAVEPFARGWKMYTFAQDYSVARAPR
jgi:hypothetical protein